MNQDLIYFPLRTPGLLSEPIVVLVDPLFDKPATNLAHGQVSNDDEEGDDYDDDLDGGNHSSANPPRT